MHAVLSDSSPKNKPVGVATPRQTASGTTDPGSHEAGLDTTVDVALTQEIGRSERLRLSIAAGLFGIAVVPWIVAWIARARGGNDTAPDVSTLWPLIALGGLAVAYELYALFVASGVSRSGRLPSHFSRYRQALIEASVPTLFLVLAVEASAPSELYVLPTGWFYLALIILSILHLDAPLSAFTGLVAGAEYAWLNFQYAAVPHAALLDPGLTSPIWPGVRAGLMIGCGLIAGVIGLRIRRQFAVALRLVRERNRVVSMFGQHVSPAVVNQLMRQDVDLQSERRDVCVMFLDIQGFTTFAEDRRPEEVVEYLNGLFSVMIGTINRHHGIVNKFLGDGFMAIFGAPIADASAADNAVAAAVEILAEVEAMSANGAIAPTTLRIGLHAGEVVTGTVGSDERKEYTIIGDVVNVASRLEQMNKQLGTRMLVTASVVERIRDGAAHPSPIGSVNVRGREHPIDVYSVA
jgi:adenylate cyclase